MQKHTRVAALCIEGVDIRVSRGNIVDEDTEALLNPTSTVFILGGQVSKAILEKVLSIAFESLVSVTCTVQFLML